MLEGYPLRFRRSVNGFDDDPHTIGLIRQHQLVDEVDSVVVDCQVDPCQLSLLHETRPQSEDGRALRQYLWYSLFSLDWHPQSGYCLLLFVGG